MSSVSPRLLAVDLDGTFLWYPHGVDEGPRAAGRGRHRRHVPGGSFWRGMRHRAIEAGRLRR